MYFWLPREIREGSPRFRDSPITMELVSDWSAATLNKGGVVYVYVSFEQNGLIIQWNVNQFELDNKRLGK